MQNFEYFVSTFFQFTILSVSLCTVGIPSTFQILKQLAYTPKSLIAKNVFFSNKMSSSGQTVQATVLLGIFLKISESWLAFILSKNIKTERQKN